MEAQTFNIYERFSLNESSGGLLPSAPGHADNERCEAVRTEESCLWFEGVDWDI